MKQATTRKASALSFERSYIKLYIKLLTQQSANTMQKVDGYFFADDGSEDELKTWYFWATALYVVIGLFVFVAIIK